MSEQRKQTWAWAWIIIAPAIPVLYVLSIGPLIWLGSRELIPESLEAPIGLLYLPLEWLYERFDLVKTLIDWYLSYFWTA